MGSVELLGIVETSDDPKYSIALRRTAAQFAEALKILDSDDFVHRKDWKKKYERKGDVCYNKHCTVGKCYSLTKTLNAPIDEIFAHHWNDIENTPEWNPQVNSVKRIHIISPTADIVQVEFCLHNMPKYSTSDVVVVKGRDFVVCRLWRNVGGAIYVAASSFDSDIPPMPKKKRATAHLVGGRFAISKSNPNATVVDYLVCVDFPGTSIPKAVRFHNPKTILKVLSSNIAEMVVNDARYAEKHIEKMKKMQEIEKKT